MSRSRDLFAAMALVWIAGSCSGEKPDQPQWPQRNYSGVYAIKAKATSNDCGSPSPSGSDSLLVTLVQTSTNRVQLQVSPVVSVEGEFHGDRLEASSAVAGPDAGAPRDTSARPAPAADSIRYSVTLDFAGKELEGEYRVEQPAMQGVPACRQAYELQGTQVGEPTAAQAEGIREPGGTP